MSVRYYSSAAGKMVLQLGVTAVATAIQVDTTAGLPGTTPFTLLLDVGQANEEIVTVNQVSGNTLVVVRGEDGTSAQPHANGAVVRHAITARDLRDSRDHENATANVHGTTSNVVGVSDTQTLTNKNLSSGTNTFPATLALDADLDAHVAATAAHGATGAVVGTTNTQALTNKDLTSGTNTFPASLATDAELAAHTGATAAHGTTGAVVGTSDTQTLTGKTIDGGTNTLSNIAQASVTGLPAAITHLGLLPARAAVGSQSLVFNGSGEATLTHNLGVTPSFISAQAHITGATLPILLQPKFGTATSTTVTICAYSVAASAPYVGTVTTVGWQVAA